MTTEIEQKPGCFSCRNCYIGFCIIFLLFFLSSACLAAASGVFKVPLFSRIFYHEPVLETNYPELKATDFQKKVENSVPKTKNLPSELTVTLTEAEAAGFLIGTQALEKADVKIKPENIWLLSQINMPSSHHWLLRDRIWLEINITPKVSQNKIDFNINKIKIGNLRIPAFGFNFVKNRITGSFSNTQEGLLEVTLLDDRMQIILDPEIINKDNSK